MSPTVSVRLLLTQSDARLAALARGGHERAFEALVHRYRRPLLRYCRRLLLPHERAEDAIQQGFLQAWLALQQGVEVTDVRPWLYRIVHNAALNILRVSGYDYTTLNETLSGAAAPHADLDRRIAVREALAGLAALPEMQREALLRTAVEGGSHEQVARDLGISENALRGLVYRARATLREAATAITPPPVLYWALNLGTRGTPLAERLTDLGAGGGSAGLAGVLMKGGAVVVSAGAVATGIGASRAHRHTTAAHPTSHRPLTTVSPDPPMLVAATQPATRRPLTGAVGTDRTVRTHPATHTATRPATHPAKPLALLPSSHGTNSAPPQQELTQPPPRVQPLRTPGPQHDQPGRHHEGRESGSNGHDEGDPATTDGPGLPNHTSDGSMDVRAEFGGEGSYSSGGDYSGGKPSYSQGEPSAEGHDGGGSAEGGNPGAAFSKGASPGEGSGASPGEGSGASPGEGSGASPGDRSSSSPGESSGSSFAGGGLPERNPGEDPPHGDHSERPQNHHR